MANVVIIGTQWGDEGKGKIVDLYSQDAHVIARFQGGNNAGHTLVVKGVQTILHIIPSGILHDGKICIVGNGVVVDPRILLQEIDQLKERELLPPKTKLYVSEDAHLIMPYHCRIDSAREAKKGAGKIGTTGRGIGPAYEDKAGRCGIRMVDLLDLETFRERLFRNVEEKNFLLTQFFKEDPVDGEAIFKEYSEFAVRLKPYIANTSLIIDEELKKGRRILFEGAQGSHLDIDHGTYPFVTSSSTVAGSACCGSGFGPTQIHSVVGIIKAYTTRVGGGPFVTELTDEIGDRIQKVGHEYGATTGRRRRCGWLDMVMIRQSVRLSGISGFALTKLDVLSGIDKIKICTAYKYKDEIIKDAVPSDLKILARCEPVYEELDGWTEDITTTRELASLPANTRKYLDRISQLSGVEIYLVSVGSGREETIVLKNPLRGV